MSGMAAWVGPAIVAAIISALVTGAGWYVAHVQDLRREADRRRETVVDMRTAILADIRAEAHRIEDGRTSTAATLGSMGNDAGFLPFVPRQPQSFILTATLANFQILPTEVIDPVVLYHRQMATLDIFTDDLRSDRFATLEAERRLAMYRDYAALLAHAAVLGRIATEALEHLSIRNSRPSGTGDGP